MARFNNYSEILEGKVICRRHIWKPKNRFRGESNQMAREKEITLPIRHELLYTPLVTLYKGDIPHYFCRLLRKSCSLRMNEEHCFMKRKSVQDKREVFNGEARGGRADT
jgi:hypothetical protein